MTKFGRAEENFDRWYESQDPVSNDDTSEFPRLLDDTVSPGESQAIDPTLDS